MTPTAISVLLVVLTTVSLSHGQDLPTTTTACGQTALKCYTDNQQSITNYLEAIDFNGGCMVYKTIEMCLNDVHNTNCGTNQEVLTVQQYVANNEGYICNSDGTVKQCGQDLQACIAIVKTIQSDFINANVKAACPVITKFLQCESNITSRKECPAKLNTVLDKMRTAFQNDDQLSGCGGNCGQAVGQCTSPVTDLLSTQPLPQMNWNDLCQKAYLSNECLKTLTNLADCSGQTTTLNDMANGIMLYVGDYCDSNGKPIDCYQSFQKCSNARNSVSQNADVPTQCKAAATYLECTSGLPCLGSTKDMIDKVRQGIETEETKDNCPSVGSCTDRIEVCSKKGSELNGIDKKTNHDQYCKVVKAAVGCFDFVKNDPICTKEQPVLSPIEGQAKQEINSICGAAGQVSFIQLWTLLFLSALVVSFRGFL